VHKLIRITLAAALPVIWAAGCSDFLKGGALTTNPNAPLTGTATNNQLFIPIQVNQFAQQNSEVAWAIAQWMQSLKGVARQQVGIYNYSSLSNGSWDGDWNTVYTGGGLIDLRTLEHQADSQGDHRFRGIAFIMEGWMIGNAADWWGAMPYSQADNFPTNPTPSLDTQQQMYAEVIAHLDSGLTQVTQGGILGGPGPGSVDLVYGGDSAKWGRLGHTLKARFLLHQVLAGAATYAQVLAQADSGILDPTGKGDYIAFFATGIQLSSNNWWQFMNGSGGTGRFGDMIASNTTVIEKRMASTGDIARRSFYFDSSNANAAGMTDARQFAGYRQPLVTYNENLLIRAEAKLHTGDAAGALTDLHAEQSAWGTANSWHPSIAVPAAGVANDSTIGLEKYIAMFQNVEVWNDWKRLCIPTLIPVDNTNPTTGFTVPSRLLDGATEEQTNPNIPLPGTDPNGAFNWNDVRQGCTDP
jgi:hypothetical protein